MKDLPLSDLRVLELSQHVSGAYCTKLLAGFGAEVIKIESPNGGDVSRHQGPFLNDIPDLERSGFFLYLNAGKKSITLNEKTQTGSRILSQLVEQADVLVEDSGPGTDSISIKTLQKENPSLIIISISWFGHDGPYRDHKGSDFIAQALGGVLKLTGLPNREPLKIAGPQAEYQAGINASIATMSALLLKDEFGAGQHVDISVMECLASVLEGALLTNSYDGTVRERDGAKHPTVCPSTILPCKDGYIHVDASTDWETFANFMDMPELLKFKPEELREKADEIDALLSPRLTEHNAEDWFHQAQEWRLPFAKVMKMDQLPNDPQFNDRNFFAEIDGYIYPGAPFKISGCQTRYEKAPTIGEHNEEIFCNILGYSKANLIQLRGMGII